VESLSKITNLVLDNITNGKYRNLTKLGIRALLNDFQYVWIKRFNISYDFQMLELARNLCNGQNKEIFKATNCKSVECIRNKLSSYINENYKSDDRIIISLNIDDKKIDTKWMD